MKRFLMALALVAVAGATYVATAPGGLQAGPTAKQFKALKRQVTTLQRQEKTLSKDLNLEAAILLSCVMHQPVAVDQVGASTDGYLYGLPGTPPSTATATSALNLAPTTETTPQHKFFELNTTNTGFVNLANSASTLTAQRALAIFGASH